MSGKTYNKFTGDVSAANMKEQKCRFLWRQQSIKSNQVKLRNENTDHGPGIQENFRDKSKFKDKFMVTLKPSSHSPSHFGETL